MSIRRYLLPSVAAVVLACSGMVADAQTGPIGGGPKINGGGKGGTGPGTTVQASGELTAESIAAMLQAQGAKTTMSTAPNGTKVVRVQIASGGWNYDFDVIFEIYPNGGKGWFLSAPLNSNANSFSQAQLSALMKKTFDLNGNAFFDINNQGTLFLETPHFGPVMTEQVFNQVVTGYLNNIRGTVDLWNVAAVK
jgi:hypothetical protein